MKKPSYTRFILYTLGFMVVYVALLSVLILVEEGAPNANIKGLGDALWYSMVTLTTVGYGDLHPVTSSGRLFGSIFLIFSLGFYGLLIGQITTIMNSIKENKKLGMNGTKFTNHVVIIGWSEFGKAVVDQLIAAGRKVAIVTKEKDSVDAIHEYYPGKQVFTLFSDYHNFDSLQKLNIEQCSMVFINLKDDTEKLVYILNMKKYYTQLHYVVTLDNGNLKSTFQSAGVTYAISKNEIASKLLASYIFEPDVALYSEEIIAFPQTDDDYDMKQFMIMDNNPYIGHEYDKAFYELKKDYNVVLIGIVKTTDGKRKLLKNPEGTIILNEGDYLIMLANHKSISKLSRFFNVEEGFYY